MFADSNRVRQLLRELFFEHQTFHLPTYLTSAYLDQRRAARSPLGVADTQLVLGQTKLTKTLWTKFLRTPLEIELLSWVFSNFPVVLITSGAGSGKSSALRHLKGYSEEIERSLEGSKVVLPAGSLILLIDFQDAPEELKQDVSTESQREQADAFLRVFCERLDTLIAGFPSDIKQRAFESTFLHLGNTSNSTGAAHVRQTVGAVAKKKYQGKTPPADLAEGALASAEFSSPHDKAVARLLLFQAIADLQSEVTDLGLVLVIDNVDPFPEYLQTALMKTIQTIVYGMNASAPSIHRGLTIAVFARLSTSTRQSGALDGVEAERFHFRAADPADIVFYRLAAFLRQPNYLPAWQRLGEHDRHEVLTRSLALLERLLDSRDQFYRVFSALAGTNIRTACKFARKWVLTPRLDDAGYRSVALKPDSIGTLLAFSMVFRVALAVERALLLSPLLDQEQDLKTAIKERFFSHLLGVLWTTGMVSLKDKRELSGGPRRAIPLASRREIEILLASPKSPALAAAVSPVARAANDLAREAGTPTQDRLRISSEIISELKSQEDEKSRLLDCLIQSDVPLAKNICARLIDAVGLGIAGRFSERSVSSVLEETVGITTRGERAVPSRWESVSILISGSQSLRGRLQNLNQTQSAEYLAEAEVLSLSAVNVFCPDKNVLLPIALHVLCILKDAHDGMDAFSLLKQLTRWGFEEDSIYRVLAEMVDIDRRLIFSAVKDSARGVRQWFDGFHKVHISSAGLGYLDAVVPTPAYLQWALLEISQVRAILGGSTAITNDLATGLKRLMLARKCLELSANEEQDRLLKLLAFGYTPFSPSLSPFSCVFFRSLRWFVEDASGLMRSNFNDALDVATSFVRLGRQVVETRSAVLGMMDPEWESNLLLAEQEIRSRFHLSDSDDFAGSSV